MQLNICGKKIRTYQYLLYIFTPKPKEKMMQSRVVATAALSKVNRLLIIPRRLASSISRGGRTADPSIHAVRPQETDDASESAKASSGFKPTTKDEDPYVPPRSPHPSSPKIQGSGVNQPQEPIHQQKRRRSSSTASPAVSQSIEQQVSCAGLDGSPWPADGKEDRREQRKEQERQDKEYFEQHKASPLSQMEMVDTRKPITRATDGTAGDYGAGLILWRPEQLDTAEDSLRRAMEIWRSNAMRGDPDSPHGRVLRALRREYW